VRHNLARFWPPRWAQRARWQPREYWKATSTCLEGSEDGANKMLAFGFRIPIGGTRCPYEGNRRHSGSGSGRTTHRVRSGALETACGQTLRSYGHRPRPTSSAPFFLFFPPPPPFFFWQPTQARRDDRTITCRAADPRSGEFGDGAHRGTFRVEGASASGRDAILPRLI
jgi:hypothetical protein